MAESNRQKCDEIFKLTAIEIFYVIGCNYGDMGGFATKNLENPERASLVEKHMKAIQLLVDCENALIDVEISLSPRVPLLEHASSYLMLVNDFSQIILGHSPLTISQILGKYPEIHKEIHRVFPYHKSWENILESTKALPN